MVFLFINNIDDTFDELVNDWIKNTKPVQLDEIADTATLVDMLIHVAQNHDGNFSSEELLEIQQAEAYSPVSEITP